MPTPVLVILVMSFSFMSIVIIVRRKQARLITSLDSRGRPAGEEALALHDAARTLGISIPEIGELIGCGVIPAWRDDQTTEIVVSRRAVEDRAQMHGEQGTVRRGARKVWRIVKWLP